MGMALSADELTKRIKTLPVKKVHTKDFLLVRRLVDYVPVTHYETLVNPEKNELGHDNDYRYVLDMSLEKSQIPEIFNLQS